MKRTLLVITLWAHLSARGLAQTAPAPAYHLETVPQQRIEITNTRLLETPDIAPAAWLVIAPVPPTCAGQDHITAALTLDDILAGSPTVELSPRRRDILRARLPVSNPHAPRVLVMRADYSLTLYARHIVSGPPAMPVAPLASAERSFSLASTPTLDLNDLVFQKWLDTNRLRRQPTESDLDFAFQVFTLIRAHYTYHYDPAQDRRAFSICQTNQSDCGGLSFLFVTALRANGVPARALVGRLAKSATRTDTCCHVKSEFFADGIGWIPVEMSGGTSDKNGNGTAYFGQDAGDTVILHIDPDMVLDAGSLGQYKSLLQMMADWIYGAGSAKSITHTDDWQVKSTSLK